MLITMPRRSRPTDDFGSRLRRLRQEHGWTMVELAQRIKSTERAILYYELEGKYPPAPVVCDLAAAFGISVESLMGRDSVPVPGHRLAGLNLLDDAEDRRLWKKFRQLRDLSERDQASVFRLVNVLSDAKPSEKSA